MKITIVAVIIVAVAFSIGAVAWQKGKREEMRAAIGKECIESGGKYHETMFRRRPVCKPTP